MTDRRDDEDENEHLPLEEDFLDRSQPLAPKRLASVRRDGIGPRLISLVNAVRVSALVGWDFVFFWPEVNGEGAQPEPVGRADAFFDAEWAAEHVVDDIRWKRFLRPKRVLFSSQVAEVIGNDERFGVRLPDREEPFLVEGEDPAAPNPSLLATFETLPFVPSIRSAIAAVDPATVADAVVVHIRRGDPGLGIGRRAWQRGRFIPLGVIDRVIADLKKDGKRVLLGGDEQQTIEMLAEVHGVGTLAALRPRGLDPRAAAFFDFRAMASAGEILSSNSRFAYAAAVIGGARPYGAIVDRLSKRQHGRVARAHLEQNHNAYGPAERAATLRWLAEEAAAGEEDRLALFRQALAVDPMNDRFARGIALSLVREGRFDEAEQLLADTARGLFTERGGRSVAFTEDADLDQARDEIAAFEAAEEAGNAGPWIAAWLSSALWVIGRNEKSLEAAAVAAARAPDDPLLAMRHGDLALRTRHHQRAHDIFERVLETNDEVPAAHIGYTDALLALGYSGDALTEMARTVALVPNEARYIARLAWYGYKFDRRPDTDRLMADAIRLGNDDPDVLRVLSFIEEERKDYAAAVALMDRAVMLRQNSLNFGTRLGLLRKALQEIEEKRLAAEQEREREARHGASDWRSGNIEGLVDTLSRARQQELAAELAAAIDRATPIGPTPAIPGVKPAAKSSPDKEPGERPPAEKKPGLLGRLWKR